MLDLKAYLSGEVGLEEYSNSLPAATMNSPGSMQGVRQFKLESAWSDFKAKFETLWADVLDTSTELYEEALQYLQEIRQDRAENCRASLTPMYSLGQLIEKWTDNDDLGGEKTRFLGVCLSRHEALERELEYMCDELSPVHPKAPGIPPQEKEQYDKEHKKDKKYPSDKDMKSDQDDNVDKYLGQDKQARASDKARRKEEKDRIQQKMGDTPSREMDAKAKKKSKKTDKAKKTEKKKVGEALETLPSVSSTDMASLNESDQYLTAIGAVSDAIRTSLLENTDLDNVSYVITEEGHIDLFCEWAIPVADSHDESDDVLLESIIRAASPHHNMSAKKAGAGAAAIAKGALGTASAATEAVEEGRYETYKEDPGLLDDGEMFDAYQGAKRANDKKAVSDIRSRLEKNGHTFDEGGDGMAYKQARAEGKSPEDADEVAGDGVVGGDGVVEYTQEQRDFAALLMNRMGLTEALFTVQELKIAAKNAATKAGFETVDEYVQHLAAEQAMNEDSALLESFLTETPGVDEPPGLPKGKYYAWLHKQGKAPKWYQKAAGKIKKVFKKKSESDKRWSQRRKQLKKQTRSEGNESFRPSDCYGYLRLELSETGTIYLWNQDYSDFVPIISEFTDDMVAETLYENLTLTYDVSAKRILRESRVAPAIYRLIEQHARGNRVPPTAYGQILSSLRDRLSVHAGMIPDRISMRLAEGFDSVYAYNYSWLVRNPQTHDELPDEINPFNGSMDDGVPLDSVPDDSVGHAEDRHPSDSIPTENDLDLDSLYQHYESLSTTPTLVIDLGERTLRIIGEGMDEDVPMDATDEDIAARLLSTSKDKGLITASTDMVEGSLQLDRSGLYEAVETPYGMVFRKLLGLLERKRGLPEPKDYPGLSLQTCESAPDLYHVAFRKEVIGSVLRKGPRTWGFSESKTGPWKCLGATNPWHAMIQLIKSPGQVPIRIQEDIGISKEVISDLPLVDLEALATDYGVKVKGDGQSWEREDLEVAVISRMGEMMEEVSTPAEAYAATINKMKPGQQQLTEPGFVKTPEDEKMWGKAKAAAGEDKGGETNWDLANHIFHKMKGSKS